MKLGRIIRIDKATYQPAFALIVTLVLMVLLAILAVGLLTLSSVSLRTASHENSMAIAKSNARLSLMLAIAKLQETAGDDRRITADGSIIDETVASPHAVGVWESWSAGLAKNTQGSAPDYDQQKQDRFVRWLVSGVEEDLSERDWVASAASGQQIDLFGENVDGFNLQGSLILTENGDSKGGFAWAVSQENTKAKLNVAGPELADRETNDDLQAQPRPNVGQSGVFSQPDDQWNQRAAKLYDYRQVTLDQDLNPGTNAPTVGAGFTTTSFGLLTDTVNGGLKVDLSLGFEMSDADYTKDSWTFDGETISNPFRSSSETAFTTPASYQTQRPLYQPITDSGTFSHERSWSSGTRDQVHSYFPVTSVPTFDTLRSFYRIPHHLYQTDEGVTVFERQGDHIAGGEGALSGGYSRPPHVAANGAKTQMAIRPVLDRVIYIYSIALHTDNTPRIAVTPVISLWNPYNTAMEIEGAVGYQWLDLPLRRTFRGTSNGANKTNGQWLSRDLAPSLNARGRSINPYFFAAITADGNSINGNATPIRFEPGEVRVFTPASLDVVNINPRTSAPRQRTIFMRPVDSISDFDLTGGLSFTPSNANIADFVMTTGDYVNITFECLDDHPICIGLGDTTVARGSGSVEGTRSQLIADILDSNFGTTARADGTYTVTSPNVTFTQLEQEPYPAMTLEVYHRVAGSGSNVQSADLVYTGNPRQSSMNPFISTRTKFQTGPQYKARMRAISSTNQAMELAIANVNRPAAYYGVSQSSGSGRTHLPFFEIPRAPLLSLAGFQHADLSPTPFAPAYQFGNSWASAYVLRDEVIDGVDGLEVDHSYLVNEALWDGYFFSGAAPTLTPGSSGGTSSVWNSPVASETESLTKVLENFAENPTLNPLRNPRMQLDSSSLNGMTAQEFADAMTQPEGCTRIAGHLMVDGSFNINSTSIPAWIAVLSGLRGASFELGDESPITVTDTLFSRLRDPLGTENDNWNGFRSLSETQIEELATLIVDEVRTRGPFLSLSEFVNRRVDDSELGLSGALQTAIDATSINQDALQGNFDDSKYESDEAENISPKDTGVGIPGYLTQADLLHSIAPVITPRSDTFTIRAYGEARNSAGAVTATAWIEACVQRCPEFVDNTDPSYTKIAQLSDMNLRYGRRFRIASFRYLAPDEAQNLSL